VDSPCVLFPLLGEKEEAWVAEESVAAEEERS